jgi:hypothetical protein
VWPFRLLRPVAKTSNTDRKPDRAGRFHLVFPEQLSASVRKASVLLVISHQRFELQARFQKWLLKQIISPE